MLVKADLRKANLRDADLCGARLTGTCLRVKDAGRAALDGTDLAGALYDGKTRLPKGFDPVALGMALRVD